ncbi:transcriptional regulator [Opitutaceae bacterium EW11]|nr:transcriptional regulator [Opitutaceae bacterium EW11]
MSLLPPNVYPALDSSFLPAVLWNRAYRKMVESDPHARPFALVLGRPDGSRKVHESRVLSAQHPAALLNVTYAERLLKFLLWQKGGSRVGVYGAPEIAEALAKTYSPNGARAFDHQFMGEKVYGEPFSVRAIDKYEPEFESDGLAIGRNLDGCRIGFDLGGSDRKAAAVIDGEVVFSEEIAWDPYFQSDPAYHIEGVFDSLKRAAAHLPRVDAIGGSAAGVYVNNEVRVASLFRGVPPGAFEKQIRPMFAGLKARFGGVPFEVVNDGEVTALAGSMSLRDNSVLGISMGTSLAAGYVTSAGRITTWLNELAFAPIDYRADAPRDEWSGDLGCGVQYLSQQAVGRLAEKAGIQFPAKMPLPERLLSVQQAMSEGDTRAAKIYETIGVYFGYAIAHYAEFFDLRRLLVLGRVSSGEGGRVILSQAENVLAREFPELAETIHLHTPDEKNKRHGQAIAAASLPILKQNPNCS